MKSNPKAVLSWVLADYEKHNEEPPERIISFTQSCEGEMMSDEEIEDYLKDSIATITILKDQGSNRAENLHEMFLADLNFLVEIGRLGIDDYNELSNLDNFRF